MLNQDGGRSMKCEECICKLGFLNGKKPFGDKWYCNDCYYKVVGELVEQYPIGTPRNYR